jgi:hypothetical protein
MGEVSAVREEDLQREAREKLGMGICALCNVTIRQSELEHCNDEAVSLVNRLCLAVGMSRLHSPVHVCKDVISCDERLQRLHEQAKT